MSTWLLLVAALFGTGATGAPAQAPPATISTRLDTTTITVGGRVRLAITVEHPPSATVVWPDSLELGPFELIQAERAEPRTEDGRSQSTAVLTLTAFELGELEVPAIPVTVRPDQDAPITLTTDPASVTVVSVGQDEGGDIRDVKGPIDMPRSWLVVALWIAALAAIGVAAYFVYRAVSRRRAVVHQAPPPPTRSPHEIAYEALDRLVASGMLERGEVKDYYITVSNIMREYVEGRFGVPALELATHEVLAGLARAGLPAERRGGFERFFETCDLVKFAKYLPSAARSGEIVPEARRLVALTEPPRIPPAPEVPPPGGPAPSDVEPGEVEPATPPSGSRIPTEGKPG